MWLTDGVGSKEWAGLAEAVTRQALMWSARIAIRRDGSLQASATGCQRPGTATIPVRVQRPEKYQIVHIQSAGMARAGSTSEEARPEGLR